MIFAARALRHDGRVSLTVVIVDDDSVFRAIAGAMLRGGGFDVVGEASSGAEAMSAVAALHPDVVLLDVQLPDTDGFAVSRQLAVVDGAVPRVVLCSVRGAEDYDGHIDGAAAAGFLSKADLSAEAVRALV